MKVLKDTTKKLYELTYLLPGDFSDAEVNKAKEEILALIKKQKGDVKQELNWGRKPLAYKIKTVNKLYQEAIFCYLEITLLPEKISDFERDLILNKNIMRHLLVKSNQKPEIKGDQK